MSCYILLSYFLNKIYALRDICPHKGPCLSSGALDKNTEGMVVGEYIYERDKDVIRCPWHSWEFDVKSGCSLFDPDNVKVKVYDVVIEEGTVFVNM